MSGIRQRLLSAAAVVLLIAAVHSQPVAAHVEAGNNGVSAVMHILPEDNPIAQQQTYIQFIFGNSPSAFTTKNCTCVLTVSKAGKQVAQVPVKPIEDSASTSNTIVTFPGPGPYTLDLSGQDGEQTFAIRYIVRVSPAGESPASAAGTDILLFGFAALSALGITAYYNISSGHRYTNSSKRSVK
jgi:hypothetical protein